MSAVPTFWTSLVVTVGKDASLLPAVQACLSWSCALQLDVKVLRGDDDADDKSLEGRRAGAVLDILDPRLHRITALNIDVKYSSSLPDYHRVLASNLRVLELQCKLDSGPQTTRSGSISACVYPSLQILVIDGQNFRKAYTYGGRREALPSLIVLEIVCFKSSKSAGNLTLDLTLDHVLDVVPQLTTLQSLAIRNVEFRPIRQVKAEGTYNLNENDLFYLTFEDISLVSLVEFFRVVCILPCSLRLVHCDINDFHNIPEPDLLILEDIDNHGDILRLLHNWNGPYLTVENCPGFDNELLEGLGPSAIVELTIIDCPNFTVDALKSRRGKTTLRFASGQTFPTSSISGREGGFRCSPAKTRRGSQLM